MGEETHIHPCVACGMCCDGTFFSFVNFRPGDDQSMFDDVYTERDRPAFKAPCQHFDSCCTVYEDRPSVCQVYKCDVLKKYESGKRSYKKTMNLIVNAKADARLVADRFPNDQNCAKFSMKEFYKTHKNDLKDPEFRKKNADLIFAIFGMKAARIKFLGRKKRSWLEKLGLRKKKK